MTTLAALAADGIYVTETDSVTVDATGAISVSQANFNSTTTPVTDPTLSDLQTTDNGPIVLWAGGDVTLNDGDGDGDSVVAHGSGTITLTADAGAMDSMPIVRSSDRGDRDRRATA